MSFKLSKAQNKEFDAHLSELKELESAVEEKVEAFNALIEEHNAELLELIEQYNEKLHEIGDFRDGIVQEMRDTFDEKSESWQEGDRGQAADQFISLWESTSLDELEATLPEPIEINFGHVEELETMERAAS